MKPGNITVTPFGLAARRKQSRQDLLDILGTIHFWRLRAVEFTLLSVIVFALSFAIAARL